MAKFMQICLCKLILRKMGQGSAKFHRQLTVLEASRKVSVVTIGGSNLFRQRRLNIECAPECALFLQLLHRPEIEALVPVRRVHFHPTHSPIGVDLSSQITQSMQVSAVTRSNGAGPVELVGCNGQGIGHHEHIDLGFDKVLGRETFRRVDALSQPAYCQIR